MVIGEEKGKNFPFFPNFFRFGSCAPQTLELPIEKNLLERRLFRGDLGPRN
jgi:hypothetical protein